MSEKITKDKIVELLAELELLETENHLKEIQFDHCLKNIIEFKELVKAELEFEHAEIVFS